MIEEMCWVKFLDDGILSNEYKYRKNEIIILHQKHAKELAFLKKAEILKTTEWGKETIINHIRSFLRNNSALDTFNLLEEAIYLEAEQAASKEIGQGRKIIWIENLHKKPVSDGRHRIVDLIFIPYLKNQLQFSENEAVTWIMNWIEKCNELQPTKINMSHVLQKFRRCPCAS